MKFPKIQAALLKRLTLYLSIYFLSLVLTLSKIFKMCISGIETKYFFTQPNVNC